MRPECHRCGLMMSLLMSYVRLTFTETTRGSNMWVWLLQTFVVARHQETLQQVHSCFYLVKKSKNISFVSAEFTALRTGSQGIRGAREGNTRP